MLEHTPARCCCTRASCVCTDSLQSGRRRRRRGDTWGRRTPAPALPAPRSHAVAVAQLAVGVPAPGVHAARLVHRDAAASQEGGGRRAAAYDQGRAAAGGGSREVGEAERGGSGGQADGPTRVAALGRARAGQAEPAPASTTHPPPPPCCSRTPPPPPAQASHPKQTHATPSLPLCTHLCRQPHATCATLTPSSPLALVGVCRSWVSPSPTLPYRPHPHPNTSPSSVEHTECSAPQATRTTRLPWDGKAEGRRREGGLGVQGPDGAAGAVMPGRSAALRRRLRRRAPAAPASTRDAPPHLAPTTHACLPARPAPPPASHLQRRHRLRRKGVLDAAQPQLAVLVPPKGEQLPAVGCHHRVGVAASHRGHHAARQRRQRRRDEHVAAVAGALAGGRGRGLCAWQLAACRVVRYSCEPERGWCMAVGCKLAAVRRHHCHAAALQRCGVAAARLRIPKHRQLRSPAAQSRPSPTKTAASLFQKPRRCIRRRTASRSRLGAGHRSGGEVGAVMGGGPWAAAEIPRTTNCKCAELVPSATSWRRCPTL